MSHLCNTKIDKIYTPEGIWQATWHKLETVVAGGIAKDGSNVPNVFSNILECPVRPSLPLAELGESDNEDLAKAMDSWKLIVADCREGIAKSFVPLHVPKSGYKIHQNRILFDVMVKALTEVLGPDGFEIVTIGTLGSFTQFFVSVLIKGLGEFTVRHGDIHHRFFNLNTSHNGLIGSNWLVSYIRAVCFNTVQGSISDAEQAGTISAIRHTENSETRIDPKLVARMLELWVSNSNAFQKTMLDLEACPMKLSEFKAFSAGVFTQKSSDELSTNSYNRIEEMSEIFTRGDGNKGESRYDAINAFTQYFTRGGRDSKLDAGKRVASANFGRGNDWKLEAIRVASNLETFEDTTKRGEVLYSDKLAKLAQAGSN